MPPRNDVRMLGEMLGNVLREQSDVELYERMEAALDRTQITPVLADHTTEAVWRTMLPKEQRVARLLVDRIEKPGMTRHEADSNRERELFEPVRGIARGMQDTGRRPCARSGAPGDSFFQALPQPRKRSWNSRGQATNRRSEAKTGSVVRLIPS